MFFDSQLVYFHLSFPLIQLNHHCDWSLYCTASLSWGPSLLTNMKSKIQSRNPQGNHPLATSSASIPYSLSVTFILHLIIKYFPPNNNVSCKFLGAHVAPNSVQMHTVNWRGCVTGSPSPMLSLRSNIASYCLCLISKLTFGMVGPWVSFYIMSPGSVNSPAACQPLHSEGRSSRLQPLYKTIHSYSKWSVPCWHRSLQLYSNPAMEETYQDHCITKQTH